MTFMVIDDESVVLRVTEAMLRRLGHAVLKFDDPRKAIKALSDSPVDGIISDVKMEGLSGFEVAKEAARILGDSPPRVLLMTGCDCEEVRLQIFSHPIVMDVLEKPFYPSELSAALDRLSQARTSNRVIVN